MVLHYKFEYVSNNNMLINLLSSCSNGFEVEYKIIRDKNITSLFVKSSIEILESFSDALSQFVPMSIFFKNIEVQKVDELPNDSIEITASSRPLTFCSNCLSSVEEKGSPEYYNPFIFCENCGQDIGAKSLVLYDGLEKIEKANFIEYFEVLAKLINDGKKVEIKTLSGEYVFSKLEAIEDKYQDRVKLLCTNLNNISEVLIASKQEVIALGSVEKPSLSLKTNAIFQAKNILKHEEIEVHYVNDMILYLLSKELEKYDISFLAYVENAKFDSSLTFSTTNQYKQIEVPKISLLENGQTLILKSTQYDNKLDTIYKKFTEKNKSQFMVLLTENELLEQSILNIYSSRKHNDCMCVYSPSLEGMLDILKFELPTSIEDIFQEIRKDEIGLKLITKYEEAFPHLYKSALCFNLSSIDKNSMDSLWKIVSLILGFDHCVLEGANDALLEKGPRIDYKLEDSDKIFNKTFNIYKLIRSGISYKLAGVDSNSLCLGYAESYAHFISNCVDMVHEELPLDGISLCGDIFSDKVISHFVHKSITKNFKIYYNKDFPIQVD